MDPHSISNPLMDYSGRVMRGGVIFIWNVILRDTEEISHPHVNYNACIHIELLVPLS